MEALNEAIRLTGGVSSLAGKLGVSQSAVSNWRARGTLLEPEHCTAIERLTAMQVRRWHLRPTDWHRIWPELAEHPDAPAQPAADQAAAA